MKKAEKVFARLGFEDLIVPIKDSEKIFSSTETYIVGYEDEHGDLLIQCLLLLTNKV